MEVRDERCDLLTTGPGCRLHSPRAARAGGICAVHRVPAVPGGVAGDAHTATCPHSSLNCAADLPLIVALIAPLIVPLLMPLFVSLTVPLIISLFVSLTVLLIISLFVSLTVLLIISLFVSLTVPLFGWLIVPLIEQLIVTLIVLFMTSQ